MKSEQSDSETRSRTRLNRVNNDVNYERKSDRRARPRRAGLRRRSASRRGGTLSMQRAVK